MMHEIKNRQNQVLQNLKSKIRHDILETMQVFIMQTHNQEISPLTSIQVLFTTCHRIMLRKDILRYNHPTKNKVL